MVALAQDASKLTDRYQTTVPSGVREHLKLGKGDQSRQQKFSPLEVVDNTLINVRRTGYEPDRDTIAFI